MRGAQLFEILQGNRKLGSWNFKQNCTICGKTVRTLGDELKANGSNISTNDLSFALLRGLDHQYNAFYASTSQLLHTLTFDDVVANLVTFDSHLARQNTDHNAGEFPPSANFTQVNN